MFNARVRADQLVLGAPWSSMLYPCLSSSRPGQCDITHRPFSNAPCSDLSGKGLGSRRRDCHFADVPSESVLKHLLKVKGGAIK